MVKYIQLNIKLNNTGFYALWETILLTHTKIGSNELPTK